MRDIKFKAFRKDKMNIGVTLEFLLSIAKDVKYNEGENKTIFLQYTGLIDKNGVEVYEGDVISLGTQKAFVIYSDYKFDNPCYCMKVLGEDEVYEQFFDKDDYIRNWFEVVGNIYENKELLGE